jgi:hypothetical protein
MPRSARVLIILTLTEARTGWLKQQVLERPRGTNSILVTHLPNMAAAFPQGDIRPVGW